MTPTANFTRDRKPCLDDVPLELYKRHTRREFWDGIVIGFVCGAVATVTVRLLLAILFHW